MNDDIKRFFLNEPEINVKVIVKEKENNEDDLNDN